MSGVQSNYRFGGFRLDRERRALLGRDGLPVSLTPAEFESLVYLLDHRHELVGRQALQQAMGRLVGPGERGVERVIAALRRVLGDRRHACRFIANVRGGYRFICPVHARPSIERHAIVRPASAATLPRDERERSRARVGASATGGRFRFGDLVLDVGRCRVLRGDDSVELSKLTFDLLCALVEAAPNVVKQDALARRAWGTRRIVTPENLSQRMMLLRRALGDDAKKPRYIECVRGQGYRLIPRVAALAAKRREWPYRKPVAAMGTGWPPSAPVTSAAVLPFADHSANRSHGSLGQAFAAELHGTLAGVARLRVASLCSSAAIRAENLGVRDIGRRLNVDYVLSGSVQCDGTELRVLAELDEAATETQLWAGRYTRESGHLLAVEREIAASVVSAFAALKDAIELRSVRGAPTRHLDAWGLVQQARELSLASTPSALAEALPAVQRAMQIDSGYAAAHAMLAWLLVERLIHASSEVPDEDERAAREFARRALVLAPRDPFVLQVAGLIAAYHGYPRKSVAYLTKAVSVASFDLDAWGAMGWPLTASGDERDLGELQRILEWLLTLEPKHPRAPLWLYHKSVVETCRGRYGAALEPIEAALEAQPELALGWLQYANTLGWLGRHREAGRALARGGAINPSMTPAHYVSLVERFACTKLVVERRVGGLGRPGAERGVQVIDSEPE